MCRLLFGHLKSSLHRNPNATATMTTIAFCAGSARPYLAALDQIPADVLVGVDAGANALAEHGRIPDWAVGDFDSSAPPAECRRLVRLPAQKDDTDLEAALSLVLAHYPPENIDRIVILGALGAGRLDHLLANVWLAHQPRFAAYLTKMLWLEHNNRMQFFRAGEHVWQRDADKKYVSFIGMTPVESLSLSGLLYPLDNAQFAHPMALVSNECLGSEMRFSFTSGLLCGIQSSDLAHPAAAK
jgi:thiamine diphosphokinase